MMTTSSPAILGSSPMSPDDLGSGAALRSRRQRELTRLALAKMRWNRELTRLDGQASGSSRLPVAQA
jgi:hypothetical protein